MTAMLALAPAPLRLLPERPADAAAVEAVVARAFGPGRFAKVSYRVRERARFRPDLSFTAWQGPALVGTVRLWSIRIGDAPAIFLGPIAVDAAHGVRAWAGAWCTLR
jgi:predicted N-acetyltransferase YhbS